MTRRWLFTAVIRGFSSYFFKTVLLFFVISVLWLHLRIDNQKPNLSTFHKNRYSYPELAFLASHNAIVKSVDSTMSANASMLSSVIEKINSLETVYNLEKFGSLSGNDVVILIQVHNRPQYLYALIESLRQARNINQTLLVFSHDLYDVRINALIQRIDFAKAIQIFYPNSTQIHLNEFPGHDPNDCPRNMKKEEAVRKGCNNAKHPDLYGHYREAKFTQIKHHWWWKLNHLMDGLYITAEHVGPVLLLEEDHYVAPDFLHVLRMMENLKTTKCPSCDILCLGTYLKSYNYAASSRKIEIIKWFSSRCNIGMAIDRSLWEQIKKCTKTFCTFDDYNWDWSLQHVSATCLRSPLTSMVALAPRVFHIGECGIHHIGEDCSSKSALLKVMKILMSSNHNLFPSSLLIYRRFRKPIKAPRGFGGWGDARDHALCCSQVKNASINCD